MLIIALTSSIFTHLIPIFIAKKMNNFSPVDKKHFHTMFSHVKTESNSLPSAFKDTPLNQPPLFYT